MTFTASLAVLPAASAGSDSAPAAGAKLDPWLRDHLGAGGADSFLVLFDSSASLRRALSYVEGAADARAATYETLRSRARSTQGATRQWLREAGIPFRSLYIVNGLQVTGDLALASALAARPDVARVIGDPLVRGIEASDRALAATCGVPWGIVAINADDVWSHDGFHGEGVVVASADTGVQWDHPALMGAYRGWDGMSAIHDFNWHDSIQDLAAPFDDYGHGSHTTGTMVGFDAASGEQIGVAPGAKWIACRNMDHGNGRPSTYLECNQFFLAPWPHGGDPERDGDPTKSPDIVNNSWGCPTSEGCQPLTLEDSFAALRAAGIMAVVSAGNSGPSCATVTDPPAIYEESFVVGATSSSSGLASFSSKGPVTVDGSNRLRPDVVAPGVGVCSSVPTNGYALYDGTSMAGPHTAGATALLWSAKPQLRGAVNVTRCVLSRTANPSVGSLMVSTCGGTTTRDRPNNLFGWGLIDIYGAIHARHDNDGDGVPRDCDCAPSDGGVYDVPAEVRNVRLDADKSTVQWDSRAGQAGSATVYDLVRGTLSDLVSQGSIQGASCAASGTSATSFSDAEAPAPDVGFYYVVQARNRCGTGGWGQNSAGAERTHAGCP